MTRPAFTHDLYTREPYLYLVYARNPGAASWVKLEQLAEISPESTAEEKSYRRVGDKYAKKIGGTIENSVALRVYWEDNIAEVAAALGQPRSGSWAGTETIDLDPSILVDVMIIGYDLLDEATAAAKHVEYINAIRPTALRAGISADGDARIAEITGSPATWYITPMAG